MDRVFFKQLELPEAPYNLDVGSGTRGEQTGKILLGEEAMLVTEKLDREGNATRTNTQPLN